MREPTNAIYPLKRDENVFIEDNIPLKLYIYVRRSMAICNRIYIFHIFQSANLSLITPLHTSLHMFFFA